VKSSEYRFAQLRVRIGAVGQQRPDRVKAAQIVDQIQGRPTLRRGKRTHVDGSVKRSHAGFISDVRIGTPVQQHIGKIVVGIDDRNYKWGGAIRIGEIQV